MIVDPKQIAEKVYNNRKSRKVPSNPQFIEGTEIPYEYKDVYDEVREAYSDCGWMQEEYERKRKEAGIDSDIDSDDEGTTPQERKIWNDLIWETCGKGYPENGRRNLNFRASRSVPAKIAKQIMDKAIIGYNAWEPALMDHIPEKCEVAIAREGSVCVYVKGTKKLSMRKLKCDELDTVKEDENRKDYSQLPCKELDEIQAYAGEIRVWWD